MKKIIIGVLALVLIVSVYPASAYLHTGTITRIEVQSNGYCFLEVEDGSSVKQSQKINNTPDLDFQKQCLALALTAWASGQEVTMSVWGGFVQMLKFQN